MNEIRRKPAHTVTELASDRQHQENPADHHGYGIAVMGFPITGIVITKVNDRKIAHVCGFC